PDGAETVERGEMVGVLLRERHGDGGFGYDPLFLPEGESRSAAELDPAEKDALSQRGQAFRALARHVAPLLGAAGGPGPGPLGRPATDAQHAAAAPTARRTRRARPPPTPATA